MKKIDWVRKLTSRKLWTAVASVVAYIIGEGLTDSANIGSNSEDEE